MNKPLDIERLRGLAEKAEPRPHEHAVGKYKCLVCFERMQAQRHFEAACIKAIRELLEEGA